MNPPTAPQHTAPKWRIHTQRPTMAEPSHRIVDTSGLLVAEGRAAGGPLSQATAHAKLIIESVNSAPRLKREHAEMLAALKKSVSDMRYFEDRGDLVESMVRNLRKHRALLARVERGAE